MPHPTPGTWFIDEREPDVVICLPDGHDRPRLRVEQTVRSIISGETEANARLIAAAPNMLEALRKIESGTIDHFAVRVARAAIRKAEGK